MRKPCGWRTFTTGAIRALQDYVEPVLFVEPEDVATTRKVFPGLEIITLPATQQYTFSSWRGWVRLFHTYRRIQGEVFPNFDLVHALEAYPSGLVGRWLASRYGIPQVLTAHGTYAILWHRRAIDRLAYEWVLRQCRLVCPVSNGTANLMRQYFGAAMQRAEIVPIENGNDYHRSVPQEQAFNRKPPELPTILTVGEVKPRKGQLISLQAFVKVKKRFPEARYWIVGEYKPNEYYHQMDKIVRKHQLEDVVFWGRVTDEQLEACYQQASLFVLASQSAQAAEKMHFEGFGLVFLEAGAYGLPVIGTRFGGVPDAIREGETGILVEAGDVDGLANAMIDLLANPEGSAAMGRANRMWAEQLTWERYAERQFKAYQQVLEV